MNREQRIGFLRAALEKNPCVTLQKQLAEAFLDIVPDSPQVPLVVLRTTITKRAISTNPYWVPVMETIPKTCEGRFCGLLYFHGNRTDEFETKANVMKAAGFTYIGDIYYLPCKSSFVCEAESCIVYQLPFPSKEDPENGMRLLHLPLHSKFYHVSECQVLDEEVRL